MSTHQIAIASLPGELSHDDATEAVYRDELDWIEEKLRLGLSVLVECDKQLTLYLYKALRRRLREPTRGVKLGCRLISGHAPAPTDSAAPAPNEPRMQRILRELQDVIFSGASDQIAVLPHLDVLTTTTRSGLNIETREAAMLLYENPQMVFLGFKDPSFELPKVIESVFTVRRSLLGIPRERLPALILQREARKLGLESFNPFRLYKYLSGLNAIRCRQILAHFGDRIDFDPANPTTADEIYSEIRRMTLLADFELPNVDLQRDIGGYATVKAQIQREIIDLLRLRDSGSDPAETKRLEQLIPKGIIFHGPPGTGKTYFAKALATALEATIIIVSGPELKSKWVGESEENLRRVFSQARKAAPSIIVFDELDSFASARGMHVSSGVEHSMVNQLLTEMDGFRSEELVFIVGTTNFMEALDPALLRPGRFELSIEISYPDSEDRRAIAEIYRDRFGLDLPQPSLEHLIRKTGGFVDRERGTRFSGDHIYAIMRGLKREELRRGAGQMRIGEAEIEAAVGTRKKRPVALSAKEERTIAVHEAGHALCAWVLPHCPAAKTVTIDTGEDDVLGYMMQKVKEHKYVTTRVELLDDICVLLGGRLAEEALLGEISIGSYDDLQRATEIGRLMVEELGMGEKTGLRTVSQPDRSNPRGGSKRQPIAEQTAERIDQAIHDLLHGQSIRAQELIDRHTAELKTMVDRLLENKTLEEQDLQQIFGDRQFKAGESGG